MPWQSGTINPSTTSPAADISKITNDLAVLKSVLAGGTDADVSNAAKATADAAIPSTQKGAANGVASLDGTGNVPAAQLGNVPSLSKIPVRQTVMSGAVDANGYANILSVGAGLVPKLLAASAAVNIAFAAGFGSSGAVDYVGQIAADTNFPTVVGSQTVSSATNAISCVITTAVAHGLAVGAWVTLSGFTPTGYNGTYKITAVTSTTFTITLAAAPGATTVIGSYTVANYLYVDRNTSNGALTLGATILPPNYQYTTASVTSGQHSFVVPSMQMYVGNGSTASAVQRVFVGECQAAAAAISSVKAYQFNYSRAMVANTDASAKAWVNFDGSLSGTIAPRGAFNVSSVTKNGTGDYTINFASPMYDANYAFAIAGNADGLGCYCSQKGGVVPTTTSLRIQYRQSASISPVDVSQGAVVIFGE